MRAYSETKAAFPKTVSNTIRYKVVPQNQWPESNPLACLRSPQNRMMENPNVTFRGRHNLEDGRSRNRSGTNQTVIQRVHDP